MARYKWKIYHDDWMTGQVEMHLMHLIAWVRNGYAFSKEDMEQLTTLGNLVVFGKDNARIHHQQHGAGDSNDSP